MRRTRPATDAAVSAYRGKAMPIPEDRPIEVIEWQVRRQRMTSFSSADPLSPVSVSLARVRWVEGGAA